MAGTVLRRHATLAVYVCSMMIIQSNPVHINHHPKDTSNCLQIVMKIVCFLIGGFHMRLSDLSLVGYIMLAPKSKCSVPGSFENEALLICILYLQEKVHQSIPKANTGLT